MSFQSQLANASEEQVRALRNDPRLFIRNCWDHPNDRTRDYDFRTTDGETRLNYLLDDRSHLNPEQWGGINILLMGRGLLKTTTMEMLVNWAHQFYGPMGLETYMAAPRQDQVKEFTGKLREKLEWSGLTQRRQKDAYEHQKFKFEPKDNAVYSHFKGDSGWGSGDSMRGPHSHFGIYDEFQDASKRSFNAGFYEVIDQSLAGVPYFPSIFIMGTPKMEGSFYNEMWQKSDQREWSPEHGTWVDQSEPETYGEGEDAVEVHGWHIDQISAPLHSESEIAAKRDLKDEQEFKNEVMAEFYSPEDHLISPRHLNRIADPESRFVKQRRDADNYVTVGVDWGGGSDRKAADTVITVMEHITYEDGSTESVYDRIDFLDQSLNKEQELEEIEKTIMTFDADMAVVDEGYGAKQREDLQVGNNTLQPDGYDQVVGCRFGNISSVDKIKWKDADEQRLFTADKSYMAKSFVDFVKAERLTLPAANLDTGSHGRDEATGTKLYRHLTSPYEEKKETRSGRKKTTITSASGDNDDAFDSSVYAFLGFHADSLGPTNTPVRFSTRDVPGL